MIRLLAVLALALLCSCTSELYSQVSERDANEILATLYAAGIHASKSTRDQKTWSVEVDEQDLQRALQVVTENGLPREPFANTGELFKKEGLISTPSEERIRYIYAVSQELSNTLSQIDGVISARVHPVIPANDPLASQIRPSSASVFIKYRRDANLEAMAPAIKNLVMHSIEGLGYENISLTFVVAEASLPGQTVPAGAQSAHASAPRGPLTAAVGAMGTVLLVAFGCFGYLASRHRAALAAKDAMRAMHESQAGADNIADAHNTSGRSSRERPSQAGWWQLVKQWDVFGKGGTS